MNLVLGTALAHFVWEGAAIAVVLAMLLAVFRESSRVRYALACAAMVAMPVAFGVTVAVVMPHASPKVLVPIPFPDIARVDGSGGAVMEGAAWSWARVLPWAGSLWMAGVAAFLLYRMTSWMVAQRLRRMGTSAVEVGWSKRFAELVARLGMSRSVVLLESCLAEVPMVIGYLRPVILLPIGMLAALPFDQVEAILLHELAHIRRADYLVNLLQTVVESVLFYHPAVWWVSSVVRAERENCCDDFVLARDTDPRAYAAALVALEESRSSEMVLAANGGDLMRRVRRVLRRPGQESSVAIGPVALAILGAGVVWAAWQPEVVKRPEAPARPVMVAQVQQEAPRRDRRSVYEKWMAEDAAYIATDAEKNAFYALRTDDEREKFVEQFWERRDPTPGTAENEYREEHYRRIAYANEKFSSSTVPGWMADRGRIYIVYGPPNEIEAHPSGGSYTRPAEQGGGTTSTYPFEKWRYRWIEGLGQNVIVEFIDQKLDGNYKMTMDPGSKEVIEPQVQRRRLELAIEFFKGELATLREKYDENHPAVRTMAERLRLAQEGLMALPPAVANRRDALAENPASRLVLPEGQPVRVVAGVAAIGSEPFNGKHSGVWIYAGGRVTFVIPLEGAGPFRLSGRLRTARGGAINYFEEEVANSASLNFTREFVLKPGSYVFSAAVNGRVETTTFEVK